MPSVLFQNADINSPLKERNRVKQFIYFLFRQYDKKLHSLTIVFCSDEYLLNLNKQFLQHDYYTDILTFDLSEDELITSEIYISVDRIKENALNNRISHKQELLRIIFHGVLHLCGFPDKTDLQRTEMTLLENKALLEFEKFHVKQG